MKDKQMQPISKLIITSLRNLPAIKLLINHQILQKMTINFFTCH